jgi:hypothetical protein
MIGVVHPYKPQNDAANSGFKIEDVTDDPKASVFRLKYRNIE